MGESPSARTQRELADLRATIDADVDALLERAREDVDPRNLVRRQPLAVVGSLGSIAVAAAVAVARRARGARTAEERVDLLLEGFGGRIDKLTGKARKRFRKQLRREMAGLEPTGPKEVVIGAFSAALGALAVTLAQGFGKRILGDDTAPGDEPRPWR